MPLAKRRKVLGIGVPLVCVALLMLLGALLPKPPIQPTANTAAPATPRASAHVSTPTPTRVSPKPAPARSSAKPTPSAAQPQISAPKLEFMAWWVGGGQDRQQAITSDFTAIQAASGRSDVPAVTAGCHKLASDVRQAQIFQAIPDAEAQSAWASALANYAAGSSDCSTGLETGDLDLATRGTTELSTGNADIARLINRVRQIAGSE